MCDATLANKGRVPCVNPAPHTPHAGCRFELTDPDLKRDHEEDRR